VLHVESAFCTITLCIAPALRSCSEIVRGLHTELQWPSQREVCAPRTSLPQQPHTCVQNDYPWLMFSSSGYPCSLSLGVHKIMHSGGPAPDVRIHRAQTEGLRAQSALERGLVLDYILLRSHKSLQVGPGAYKVAEARVEHGFAPFQSTAVRDVRVGPVTTAAFTPGPGFYAGAAVAQAQHTKQHAAVPLGGTGPRLAAPNTTAQHTPGPGQYQSGALAGQWLKETYRHAPHFCRFSNRACLAQLTSDVGCLCSQGVGRVPTARSRHPAAAEACHTVTAKAFRASAHL
jgi:hypothetical protein